MKNLPHDLRSMAKYPFVHLPSDSATLTQAADAIESLTKALDFWKNGHMEMTKELFDVKRANDTAVDEYIKSEEKVVALTAELALAKEVMAHDREYIAELLGKLK